MATHIKLRIKNGTTSPVKLSNYYFQIDRIPPGQVWGWQTQQSQPELTIQPNNGETTVYLPIRDGANVNLSKIIPADGKSHYFKFATFSSTTDLLLTQSIQYWASFGTVDSINTFVSCSPEVNFKIDSDVVVPTDAGYFHQYGSGTGLSASNSFSIACPTTHVRLRITPLFGNFQIGSVGFDMTTSTQSRQASLVNISTVLNKEFIAPINNNGFTSPIPFDITCVLTIGVDLSNSTPASTSLYAIQFGTLVSGNFSPISQYTPVDMNWTPPYTTVTSYPTIVKCDGSCFVENTLILTDKGYVNVQDLKKDDIIVTHDNRHVPIKAVICTSAQSTSNTDPFLYKANCFSQNYPPIDTYLSPHHAILINDKWDVKGRSDRDLWTKGVHLKYNNFLNENIKQVKIADTFNYYHIYLPDFKTDHLVINHGLVVESYGMDYHITHTHFPEDPRVFIVDLKKKVDV